MSIPRLRLLTTGNPKTAKGREYGFAVAVLHLAPSRLSGFNVCPQATDGCIAACLNTAGRGGIAKGGNLTHADIATGTRTNAIQDARVRRTRALFGDRRAFFGDLRHDIATWSAWCVREGFKPAIRLNGTSDLSWEALSPLLFADFPDVTFYDYTKVTKRTRHGYTMPVNYRLTLSLTEGNDREAADALDCGGNVAAVFSVKRGAALPETYTLDGRTYRVIDGDAHDLRFLDPRGVIVGLYAKGQAKRDTSGFVRPYTAPHSVTA